MNATRKLYYEDPYLASCHARVVNVGADFIETDQTVAYPEGGGQEADMGSIYTLGGKAIRFVWASKMLTRNVYLPSIPMIESGGVIRHLIDPRDISLLGDLRCGMDVVVAIDATRRALLSLSHTASHLLYVAVGIVRPRSLGEVIGCHIKTDGARFDFLTQDRFSPTELDDICAAANELVSRDSTIRVYAHRDVPDARFWECEEYTVPCGGTHITHTRPVGPLTLQRRRLGRNKERIACAFAQAQIDGSEYHE